jgi:hypothetical protein
MSEHVDVREALEVAAAEPGGLDRLEAGDTPEAIAVAGHLAACPDCLEEMARLRRAETLLRPIVAEAPDPALRERTLELVRTVGVPRGAAAAGAATGPSVAPPTAAQPAEPVSPRPARRAPAWIAAIAVVLVVGLVGGTLISTLGKPAGNKDPAKALAAVSQEISTLEAAGDARTVVLVDSAGTPGGMLVLSPAADRVVVTATGLAAPPAGSEYRCWVAIGGERRTLGVMWEAGAVEWWAGDVPIPADVPPGAVYGVSLATTGSSDPGTDVLTGAL